MGLIRLPESGY